MLKWVKDLEIMQYYDKTLYNLYLNKIYGNNVKKTFLIWSCELHFIFEILDQVYICSISSPINLLKLFLILFSVSKESM